jgi:hypothetical protein
MSAFQSLRQHFAEKPRRPLPGAVLKPLAALKIRRGDDCAQALRKAIDERLVDRQAIFVEVAGFPARVEERDFEERLGSDFGNAHRLVLLPRGVADWTRGGAVKFGAGKHECD